jgi:Tfp pilus assembly protein PilE
MKVLHTKRALTILEATVTVLVLTVVSFIIFKKFISLIEFSRCREAFENIDTIRRSLEECYYMKGSYSACSDIIIPTISSPSEGAHFIYEITSSSRNEFEIVATRTAIDGGLISDTVTFKKDETGSIVRSGTGAFRNIH